VELIAMGLERIGRYEVLATLARGGMSVVYKAKDPLIDRIVAIKTLGIGLSPIEAETFRKRFAREAKSAGGLNHPNIVTIHDMGESNGGAYIAMEFLEGRTLRDILDSGVVLRPATIADIALQVADGLAFAHQNEVIHCDIKPANIMVLENGAVKIMDFGIARLPTGSRTFAGNVLGSPRYISPEQIVGRPVDARSDIFALGAVLYEMLTGVPPFAGTAIDEILYQVINEKPQAPSLRNTSLPPDFDEIVVRAMAKHPDDRYQSVEDFASALRKLALVPERLSIVLPPAAGQPSKPSSPGMVTVQLDEPVAGAAETGTGSGDEPSADKRRRKLALYAIPAALVVMGAGWKLLSSNSGAEDRTVEQSASSSAQGANGAALKQPAAPATKAAVIPPLDARPISETGTAAPPMESNTKPAPSMVPRADATHAAANAMGRLGFAISPWGEVYVDGRKRGVTPPMTELKLPPGTYKVEIRNTGFAPHSQTIELGADATLRIKHRFR
jgi:eukaryotic-like serine/threonine-protein kinase